MVTKTTHKTSAKKIHVSKRNGTLTLTAKQVEEIEKSLKDFYDEIYDVWIKEDKNDNYQYEKKLLKLLNQAEWALKLLK